MITLQGIATGKPTGVWNPPPLLSVASITRQLAGYFIAS